MYRRKNTAKILLSFAVLITLASCGGSPKKAEAPPPSKKDDMMMALMDDAPAKQPAPTPAQQEPARVEKSAARAEPPKPVSNFAALARTGRLDQLRDEAVKALAVNANDPAALNALAFSYYKKNKMGAARIVLDRANERNPNTPQILTNMAILDLADNEPQHALTNLKKSYRLDDHNAETLALIGSIYIQNRDYARALAPLQQSYLNDKTNIKVANNYAVALTKTKSYESAQKIYDEILVQNARESEILLNYAMLLVDYLNKPKEGLNLVYKVKFIETERQDMIELANKIENRAKSALK